MEEGAVTGDGVDLDIETYRDRVRRPLTRLFDA
jgi:hypothetical protein